ncbi:hypothetical protein ACIRCZ_18965 [Leifsonia sp. NPDC102414]|uniref:hypothetical protein n=1 Tax=Leifsonia sp. NPDC102414 TaxID=3364124 RepID=UPI0038229DCD
MTEYWLRVHHLGPIPEDADLRTALQSKCKFVFCFAAKVNVGVKMRLRAPKWPIWENG